MADAFLGLVPIQGIETQLAQIGKIVTEMGEKELKKLLPVPYPQLFRPGKTDKETEKDLEDQIEHKVIRVDDVFGILDKQLSDGEQTKDIAAQALGALTPIASTPEDNPRIRVKKEVVKYMLRQSKPVHTEAVDQKRTRRFEGDHAKPKK